MSLGTVTTTLHSTAVTNYKGQTELSPKREHGNEKQPSAAVSAQHCSRQLEVFRRL